jgi:hypothetical protein
MDVRGGEHPYARLYLIFTIERAVVSKFHMRAERFVENESFVDLIVATHLTNLKVFRPRSIHSKYQI